MKKYISLILVIATFFIFAIPCLADTYTPPEVPTSLLKSYYLEYYNYTYGTWRLITSDNMLFAYKNDTANAVTLTNMSTSTTWSTPAGDFEILTDNDNNPLNGVYGVNDSAGAMVRYEWNPSSGSWTKSYSGVSVTDASATNNYFTNQTVKQYKVSTGLYTSFFKYAPLRPLQTINQPGGLILQGALQTSLIALATGLILLAILLGISLVPRLIKSMSR